MINYAIIDASIKYYEALGYVRIEAPWTVTKEVSAITRPPDRKDYEILGKDKVLVASAEQSFLYLYLKGFLPKGRFQAVTPCFRDEPHDITHTKYFIKNELIDTVVPTNETAKQMAGCALTFFMDQDIDSIAIIKTKIGYDVVRMKVGEKPLELGSYGVRECSFLKWAYGTGCAEPRLSNLINQIKYGRIPH